VGRPASSCLWAPARSGTALEHHNGFGQTYLDCAPLGTLDSRTAQAACAAFTGDGALCRTIGCGGGGDEVAVCSKDAEECICWSYAGSAAGHARDASGGGCECPSASDAAWD
jgi:hypothetical protein